MKRLFFLIPLLAIASPIKAGSLTDATKAIGTAVDSNTVIAQQTEAHASGIISKYKLTNAGKCAMLVVGTSSTGTVPIYFVPGPQPITGFQADLSISTPSVSITSMAQGPDLSTYGKQLSSNKLGSSWRFIASGLNRTTIGPGAMAVASLDTLKLAKGAVMASLSNFVASDENGNTVPMCVTTGVITK